MFTAKEFATQLNGLIHTRTTTCTTKKKHSLDSQRIINELEVEKCTERLSEMRMSSGISINPKLESNKIKLPSMDHNIITSPRKPDNNTNKTSPKSQVEEEEPLQDLDNTEIVSFFSHSMDELDEPKSDNHPANLKRPSVSFDSYEDESHAAARDDSVSSNGYAKKSRRGESLGDDTTVSCMTPTPCSTRSRGNSTGSSGSRPVSGLQYFHNLSPLPSGGFSPLPPIIVTPRMHFSKHENSSFSPIQHIRTPVNDTSSLRKKSLEQQQLETARAAVALHNSSSATLLLPSIFGRAKSNSDASECSLDTQEGDDDDETVQQF